MKRSRVGRADGPCFCVPLTSKSLRSPPSAVPVKTEPFDPTFRTCQTPVFASYLNVWLYHPPFDDEAKSIRSLTSPLGATVNVDATADPAAVVHHHLPSSCVARATAKSIMSMTIRARL